MNLIKGAWVALAAFGLATALASCAPNGPGIDDAPRNPTVVIPAQYAKPDITKGISDQGATAEVVVSTIEYVEPAKFGQPLDMEVHWRITATSNKPFRVVVGATGYGYGTLASFNESPFTATGGPSAHPGAHAGTPLRDVTLKKGEATEGWVEYHVPDSGKPVVPTWSAANDKSQLLAFWENGVSLNK